MQEPNLHQLRIFESVARLGSFSRAARELTISQPAVSVQVQELERASGTALLQRLGRRIVPTEAGETVLRYSRDIFSLVEEMGIAISELRGLHRGTVRIGASSTLAEYVLPSLLARYREDFPDIAVQLTILPPDQVVQRVLSGELSLGFAAEPEVDHQLVAHPIGQDELVVVAAFKHRFRDRRAIPVTALRAEHWILAEPGAESRVFADRLAIRRGFQLTASFELSSHEAIKRAVIAGLGIALMPKQGIEYELAAAALVVLDVPDLVARRTLAVVHHRQQRLNRAETALLDLAKTPERRVESVTA